MKRLLNWWLNRRTLADIESEMMSDVRLRQWEIDHGYDR